MLLAKKLLDTTQWPLILKLNCIVPFFFLLAFIFLPEVSSGVFGIALFFFHLHICINLTFDGFVRFSRYRLSRNHPILDKVVSTIMIVISFLGFSVIALFMKSYSLAVSPNDNKKALGLPFYNQSYIVPLTQALILIAAIVNIYYRY